MKIELSVKKKNIFNNIVIGGIWISFGIAQVFYHNKVVILISLILLLIATCLQLISYFGKGEKDDEMSICSRDKARSMAYQIIILLLSVLMTITIVKDGVIIRLEIVLPFAIGVVNLLEGILFVIFDNGEDVWLN